MKYITRKLVLTALAHHETLTVADLSQEKNLGLVPDQQQLAFLLHQLSIRGHIQSKGGTMPPAYAITGEGLQEVARLGLGSTEPPS